MIEFPKYTGRITKVIPDGIATVNEVVQTIKYSNNRLLTLFRWIREAKQSGDAERVSYLKSILPFWLPAVQTDMKGRSYKNITAFTGLMPLDFDGLESRELAERFRDVLFEKNNCVLLAWLSSSAKGVRAIVRIPIVESVDEFKGYFWGIRQAMIDHVVGFDNAPSNPILPMFCSHDTDIRIRKYTSTAIWTGIAGNPKPTPPTVSPPINLARQIETHGDKYKEWTINNVTKSVESITSNGHTQLRSAARAMGGRIPHYISFEEAEYIIHRLIEGNAYLQKGIKGYQKTATTMLNYGMGMPTYF